VPRIGEEATAQLRRSANLALLTGPVVLALAVGCSFAFGSGTAFGVALGLILAALAVLLFVAFIHSRMKLARAVSRRFGVRIGWWEMPRMRTAQFEAWRERRGLTSARD
jgi:peptidoglycan/LPS O-acetylase OafA/YrhL